MLVTSGGLNDPRVRRSMRAASRAGLEVRLVCRPLSRLQADSVKAPPTQVHYVPRAPGFGVLKRLFPGWPQTQPTGRGTGDSALPASSAAGPLWLRPRELWTLLGIAWFNVLAVLKVWRYPAILVHANDLDTLAAGVILSRFKRAPLLYDAHELFTAQFTSASRQFRAILFGLEHRLIRRTDCVVTVNQSIADTLAAWHGVPVPRVVMNCPSVQELARADSGRLGSRRESVMRVIYQGVYRTERGLEELILSAARFDSAELYLRGYGDLEPALRTLVEREGLRQQVHFLPPADPGQMVESLLGFDIGVVPYRPTNLNQQFCLPNKVFEYLQAGLALAVSALPELERLVKETGTGEVFDPERPEDITRAINFLTSDVNRLADLKARARAAGRERYTWEAQGEPQLLSCYRELMGVSIPGMEA